MKREEAEQKIRDAKAAAWDVVQPWLSACSSGPLPSEPQCFGLRVNLNILRQQYAEARKIIDRATDSIPELED